MSERVNIFNNCSKLLRHNNIPFLAWIDDTDQSLVDMSLSPIQFKAFLRHLVTTMPETVPLIGIVQLEAQVMSVLKQRGVQVSEKNGLVV